MDRELASRGAAARRVAQGRYPRRRLSDRRLTDPGWTVVRVREHVDPDAAAAPMVRAVRRLDDAAELAHPGRRLRATCEVNRGIETVDD